MKITARKLKYSLVCFTLKMFVVMHETQWLVCCLVTVLHTSKYNTAAPSYFMFKILKSLLY